MEDPAEHSKYWRAVFYSNRKEVHSDRGQNMDSNGLAPPCGLWTSFLDKERNWIFLKWPPVLFCLCMESVLSLWMINPRKWCKATRSAPAQAQAACAVRLVEICIFSDTRRVVLWYHCLSVQLVLMFMFPHMMNLNCLSEAPPPFSTTTLHWNICLSHHVH